MLESIKSIGRCAVATAIGGAKGTTSLILAAGPVCAVARSYLFDRADQRADLSGFISWYAYQVAPCCIVVGTIAAGLFGMGVGIAVEQVKRSQLQLQRERKSEGLKG